MTTVHDDLPHPVPAHAFLRYKENYFFIVLAEAQGVFGVFHLNHEPGFDRARYTCNLSIGGRPFAYANATPFPERFAFEREIGDGALQLRFVAPHRHFALSLNTGEIDLAIDFTAAHPTFDYAACRTAGNPAPSFQEVNTLGLNLPYNHQQQSLVARGRVMFGGETIAIDGSGYRDHSWVMRGDSVIAEHLWCGFNFPGRAFGAKTNASILRPDAPAREGYVVDAEGPRALRLIETRRIGESADGLPDRLIHELTDVFGRRYTIESDIAGRLAHVPLVSEASGHRPAYHIVENFCRTTLRETGETGIALVEIGRNATVGGAFA